jgi:transcription antitermination factor NusG
MPLLPAEPFHYPANLFLDADAKDDNWWVLHTRPRAEKSIARSLLASGCSFFLPVYEQTRKVKNRVQTSHLPLFSGYLFLRGSDETRGVALETNQVANCLPVVDGILLRSELEAVYRVMTCRSPFGPEETVARGTPVRIVHGPLAGVVGKVLRRGKQLTIVVEIQMLQRGVSVEIEDWMLALEPPAAAGTSPR